MACIDWHGSQVPFEIRQEENVERMIFHLKEDTIRSASASSHKSPLPCQLLSFISILHPCYAWLHLKQALHVLCWQCSNKALHQAGTAGCSDDLKDSCMLTRQLSDALA